MSAPTDNRRYKMDDLDSRPEKPSKTQRKREMEELQSLGEMLLTFSLQKLSVLNLPDALTNALKEAKRISQQKARRRHDQYIGKLMRDLDEETINSIRQYLSKQGK